MRRTVRLLVLVAAIAMITGCGARVAEKTELPALPSIARAGDMDERLSKYTSVRLSTALPLDERELRVVELLIEASQPIDAIFWKQAYGNRDSLLQSLRDPAARAYALINYGPWDRLAGNEPFVQGVGPKPPGANFYPADMTREEFERAAAAAADGGAALRSEYTIVRRSADGSLRAIPYHEAYAEQVQRAVSKLREAATYADDPGLRRYLELRAQAMLTDDYRASDMAWLDMRTNTIDVIFGPIEHYEDGLLGLKTAHESLVLVKDMEWSQRLSRFAAMLPDLQRGLPVEDRYKREEPGTDSDLNAYDVVYYAGDGNAGSKPIAVNLPNDEQVQLEKGTRRLQLQNAMRAKFEEILVPISEELIAEDQRRHVSFNAFFNNVMFHEVAHGLGIKNTVTGRGTVREALGERHAALEEGKADVLGLYMLATLHERGELGAAPMEDYYVTFLASIFRSVRFGAASAHGRANMARFNFFQEMGAFSRDAATNSYRVHFDRMRDATNALSARILTLQGDGDPAAVDAFMQRYGNVPAQLRADLDRLAAAEIPVDIVFEQGVSVWRR
jgi:hypothetical protein